MKEILAILSIVECLWAMFRHQAVLNFAERNVPSYMRDKTGVIVYGLLGFASFALAFVSLFNLAWYWAVLISIPAAIILYFVFYLIMELIVHPNSTFVNGRSGISLWSALILSLILAIVAFII